jgi:HlyD family secretion protein
MKKLLYAFIGICVLGIFVWTGWFLFNKSQKDPVMYKTEQPFVTDIVKKTVATGSIKPRVEINIKPQVTGVIEKLFVEAGQPITVGQPIARIRIVPNVVTLNNAEAQVKRAQINLENNKRELERNEPLFKAKVIPEVDFNRFKLNYDLAKQELDAAESNLQLVREGASKLSGTESNMVYSTSNGLILDVPVKEGGSVVERSNFNEGTTLATIADMRSMIFIGDVDESEVGKLREGQILRLTVGAIEGQSFDARLEYIAPKGNLKDGAIKFEIRAAVILKPENFIRAGYSANADIVVGRREKVLALKESLVEFKGDSAFVEVEKAPQQFAKRYVKTGLSDGVNIEVLDGVKKEDKIKAGVDDKKKDKPKEGNG